jgi:1-deoxy-D-xylulose-5-phosphate reductoisomerase
MIKIVAHDTDMKIPIYNSLNDSKNMSIITDKINLKKLNSLNFKKVNTNKFPSIKLLRRFKNKESLIETIIVLANDELVKLFLLKKLKFTDMNIILQKLINMKELIKISQKKPMSITSIISLKELIGKKINKIIN